MNASDLTTERASRIRAGTIERMAAEGGEFVNRLAHAAAAADRDNYARLSAAFPELWERYMPDRLRIYPNWDDEQCFHGSWEAEIADAERQGFRLCKPDQVVERGVYVFRQDGLTETPWTQSKVGEYAFPLYEKVS